MSRTGMTLWRHWGNKKGSIGMTPFCQCQALGRHHYRVPASRTGMTVFQIVGKPKSL
ncbi:hypothetical protein GOM44_03245 [Wolbachia endosymbiont of Atemnus politus]|uniref:hypothetical protein n=1 Tax=Wolbachia endosymbiont of Atemnus politus TaxID=2682840 RepID=UPI0015720A79|nr:hypothetical protein [Wolbachia endosymbiont of Atemnus politus]NSX83431.1 hypothetical protein [Wolbachia endosymbiont of Atemnus politus]